MQNVKMIAHISDCETDYVFSVLCDFDAYSALCPSVRSVKVYDGDGAEKISDWEVNFNNGILKWRERDIFDYHKREIRFTQVAGDIDHFSGIWRVEEHPTAARITFQAQFDLGLPMLADMLNPIAEKAIRENIGAIIRGLFNAETEDVITDAAALEDEHDVA